LSGIGGGIGLPLDPSGNAMRIPIEWLEGSPFNNYLTPGLILLIVLGIFPLIAVYGLWKRLPWARKVSILIGVALIIWITVEIIIIGYQPDPPLQAIYGPLGVVILILSLPPAGKRVS